MVSGHQFLSGSTLGLELLREIKTGLISLATYLLHIDTRLSDADSDLSKARDEVTRMSNNLLMTVARVETLEEGQRQIEASVGDISQKQKVLQDAVEQSAKDQKNLATEITKLEEQFDLSKTEENETKQKLTKKVNKLTERVNNIEHYHLMSRPDKIFFYTPDRITCFVGRKEELQNLEDGFCGEEFTSSVQVISGLGGSGKTTVAVEYSWLMQKYYTGGVFWIAAEDNMSLEESVGRLAVDAGTLGKNFKETFLLTLKWLGSLSSNWLLIVDNVDQEELTNEMKDLLIGTWKRNSKGHILVTTRREPSEVEDSLKIDPTKCVVLGPMTNMESIEFMLKRSGKTNSDESLESLVVELDGLPLAMEQAAAHVKTLKCSFEEYLERFRQKRLKLSQKRITTTYPASKERLAVKTTWQINFDYICRQSEEEGLGKSVPFVMNMTAFFSADDIPEELLNKGAPEINDDDLKDAMADSMGVKQVIGILTRFSLFQRYREGSFQVHRLVQEVIRDNLTDVNDKANVIQGAIRMLNSALRNHISPENVLEVQRGVDTLRGGLHLWSKLGRTACSLRSHINSFVRKDGFEKELLWTFESLKIFQTAAIFHSIYHRQAEALSAQAEMLHMMTLSDLSVEQEKHLTSLKVPVHDIDRKKIQACIESTTTLDTADETTVVDPNTLRENGNKAYKANREHDAIQFYTAGIRSSKEGQIDARLYANRSLCFLRIHDYERALEDADSCISIDPSNWKAHLWRAYAIGNLIENGKRPMEMEATGLASASIAGYIHPQCKLEFRMKIFYPILVSRVVHDSATFLDEFSTLYNQPYTTLLLRNGRYNFGQVFATKTIQMIGIGDKVEIFTTSALPKLTPSRLNIQTNFTPEKHIKVHFENIHFVRGGGQIIACADTTVSFYRCKFSNGEEACDDFPSCKGGPGCKNSDRNGCLLKYKMFESTGRGTGHFQTGIGGISAVCAETGGQMVLERCVLDRCGGALADGKGAVLKVTNSIIQNNRQSGLEAREDGELYAVDNIIQNNQTHGALIGPCGRAILKRNIISGNWREGIFSCELVENSSGVLETVKRGSKSVAVFEENVISHNGLCGISLDGGTFIINGNKIFENWCWGVMAKTRASCNITNNDLYNNKCGGLRIGFNYSAVMYLDGNTIRDHTGPHLYTCLTPPALKEAMRKTPANVLHGFVLSDEMMQYTSPPIITNRNVFRQNDLRIQHPSKDLIVVNVCSFCHRTGKGLKKCASCKTALYCSKDCQTSHWKRHKHFCKLFKDSFTVQIIMKYTKPVAGISNVRIFDPSLKGIKEGPKPNRKSTERFIVKIQSGLEYSVYDPQTELLLYDRSTDLDILLQSPQLYYLIMECGILSGSSFTTKKIFCWASFEKEGKILKVFTDSLPPFQTW